MYTDNELLFPRHIIPELKRLRSARWQTLVDRVLVLPEFHEEALAFMLMMIRLNGCVPCETDSYRAMRGCSACAVQTLRRFKGDDEALIAAYEQALVDIRQFSASHPNIGIVGEDTLVQRSTA